MLLLNTSNLNHNNPESPYFEVQKLAVLQSMKKYKINIKRQQEFDKSYLESYKRPFFLAILMTSDIPFLSIVLRVDVVTFKVIHSPLDGI